MPCLLKSKYHQKTTRLLPAFKLMLLVLPLLLAAEAHATTYATWLMVWNGHTEKWWKPTDYEGARVYVGGTWKAIDWADNSQINEYLDNCKKAGIQLVIVDLTNGWGWLNTRSQYMQSLCAQKGLKFCVAENSLGNAATFETHAQDIWNNFAGPTAPHAPTYVTDGGKSLIVCYSTREWFHTINSSPGPWRSKFKVVWASGEDSDANKWGWQLEPWIGSVPSPEAMFVTSAIKWNSTDETMWRKSLAWLDYNFALAKSKSPAYIIVGSYDDIHERNSWLVADTANCIPGCQMRDQAGAISTTAYYQRVQQWIAGTPPSVPGGYLRDGAYRVLNRNSGKALSFLPTDSTKPTNGSNATVGSKLVQAAPSNAFYNYFWFYHLGHNQYKIMPLHSGLALEAPNGDSHDGLQIDQGWNTTDAWQRWTVQRVRGSWYRIQNEATGKVLEVSGALRGDGAAVVQGLKNKNTNQQWRFERIVGL
ncbi:MAG: RICIN domain-containing protein [Abitibacteriaceae bacterium]|nr:RICIN domain-containing protein [Abditibacteriaceae bacterium]